MTQTLAAAAPLAFYPRLQLVPCDCPSGVALAQAGQLTVLDGTTAPLYKLNDAGHLKLNRTTAPAYARFVFEVVGSDAGYVDVVEPSTPLFWLPQATRAIKQEFSAHLRPLRARGSSRKGFFHLQASLLFCDALFSCDIVIAARPITLDFGDGEPVEMVVGQIYLTSETLLMEGLPICPPLRAWEHTRH